MDHLSRRKGSNQQKNRLVSARWNTNVHFHQDLKLPSTTPAGVGSGSGSVTVLLEAMARECARVAFSPETKFIAGKTYEVFFGAAAKRRNYARHLRRRALNHSFYHGVNHRLNCLIVLM
jgi:hypothetical protein